VSRARERAGGAPRERVVLVAAAVGLVTGLASTYPWELGPVPAIALWAVVGVLLGTLLGRTGRALTTGVVYGVLLTVAFLYSRFGGAPRDLPVYTLFVLAMCIGGAAGGFVTVFLGSRLHARG
jgi:hypothetical protein